MFTCREDANVDYKIYKPIIGKVEDDNQLNNNSRRGDKKE